MNRVPAVEVFQRVMLGRLAARMDEEVPRAVAQGRAMGDRLSWYYGQHPDTWKRWLKDFPIREQRVLSASYDVQMGLDWLRVTAEQQGSEQTGSYHLAASQSHVVAAWACFERLRDLVKITRRQKFISKALEDELVRLIDDCMVRTKVDSPRHEAAHSSVSRDDAWLRAPEDGRMWEILAIAVEYPEFALDPVGWFTRGVTKESMAEIAESGQRRRHDIEALAEATFARLTAGAANSE